MRILLTLLLAAVVSAQDRFEVASIKPAAPRGATESLIGDVRGGPGTESPTQILWRANSLSSLIREAFGVKPFQVVAPAWISTTTFDVAATLPPGTTKPQLATMLRTLLAERFGLAFHKDAKEVSAYALTVAKEGPKLTATAYPDIEPAVGGGPQPGGGIRFQARAGTMAIVALMLEAISFRSENAIVVDKTGLAGKYDFELRYADNNPGAADSGLPTLATALEQDLGLKLEKSKVQVDIIVVERISRTPTEN